MSHHKLVQALLVAGQAGGVPAAAGGGEVRGHSEVTAGSGDSTAASRYSWGVRQESSDTEKKRLALAGSLETGPVLCIEMFC